MNQAKLELSFTSNLSNSTFEVSIYDRAHVLLYRTRTNLNSICVCCKCAYLISVQANANGVTQTISRFVSNLPCRLSMNFDFNFVLEPLQRFVLLDKTYGFPIKKANLFFKSQ